MKCRDIGLEILEGLNEIGNFKQGKVQLKTAELSEPKVIRSKLNLSQSAFAGLLGVSIRTLQDWEQGRRNPQGPAMLCYELQSNIRKFLLICTEYKYYFL